LPRPAFRPPVGSADLDDFDDFDDGDGDDDFDGMEDYS
jgi:hypothetical protein